MPRRADAPAPASGARGGARARPALQSSRCVPSPVPHSSIGPGASLHSSRRAPATDRGPVASTGGTATRPSRTIRPNLTHADPVRVTRADGRIALAAVTAWLVSARCRAARRGSERGRDRGPSAGRRPLRGRRLGRARGHPRQRGRADRGYLAAETEDGTVRRSRRAPGRRAQGRDRSTCEPAAFQRALTVPYRRAERQQSTAVERGARPRAADRPGRRRRRRRAARSARSCTARASGMPPETVPLTLADLPERPEPLRRARDDRLGGRRHLAHRGAARQPGALGRRRRPAGRHRWSRLAGPHRGLRGAAPGARPDRASTTFAHARSPSWVAADAAELGTAHRLDRAAARRCPRPDRAPTTDRPRCRCVPRRRAASSWSARTWRPSPLAAGRRSPRLWNRLAAHDAGRSSSSSAARAPSTRMSAAMRNGPLQPAVARRVPRPSCCSA